MKNYFKQVTSLQYISHISATKVAVESVKIYKLLSMTLISFNLKLTRDRRLVI